MTLSSRPALRFALLALLPMISGCASGPPSIRTEAVALRIGQNLNDDQPLAVDLVYVDDKDLADRLAKTPALEWFRNRPQILRDYPRGVTVHGWELVPTSGAVTDHIEGPLRDAIAVFLFANYSTAGDHRARLDLLSQPLVWLQTYDIHVEEAAAGSR